MFYNQPSETKLIFDIEFYYKFATNMFDNTWVWSLKSVNPHKKLSIYLSSVEICSHFAFCITNIGPLGRWVIRRMTHLFYLNIIAF